MSEFQPVRTKADLEKLEDDDILTGYIHGLSDPIQPGSDKSRGYWHGWRNAQSDKHRVPIDDAQMQLVREVVGTYKGLN